MDSMWLILRQDLKSLALGRGRTMRQRIGAASLALLWIILGCALGYGTWRLFGYLGDVFGAAPDFRAAVEINLLNASNLFVLTMAILTGMQMTYRTVYESPDVGFLLCQPVPARAVFGAKFLSSFIALAAMTVPWGFPVWLAFGAARGLGAGFYLLTAAAFLLLLMVCHGVISLVLIAAMRFLPGRKLKQLFIAFSAIFGILTVLVSQMLSARLSQSGDPTAIIESLGRGQLAAMWYLPATWMTRAVLGCLRGFGVSGTGGWAALVGLSALSSYASFSLSEKWYLAGWAGRGEEISPAKRKHRKSARTGGLRLQGAYWSVLRKDLTGFVRDPLVWYTAAVAAIGLGFFAYNMMNAAGKGSPVTPDPAEIAILSALMVLMPVLMGGVTSAQTGGVSLSREGDAFWILRACPVGSRELILAKFTYAMLPPLAFSLVFQVFLEFTALPRGRFWLGLIGGVASSAAVAALQVALDVYFPDFSLKVEFGSSGGKGTGKILMSMFSSMAMLALIAVVLLVPVMFRERFGGDAALVLSAAPYALLLALALGLMWFLLGPAARRLKEILTDM